MTYPQQPGYGQQYGPPQQFPGQPGAYGPPPGQWGPPPKKKSPLPWILGGVGALVVVIAVVVGLVFALGGSGSGGLGGLVKKSSLANKSTDELMQALNSLPGLPPGVTVKVKPNKDASGEQYVNKDTFEPSGCAPPFEPKKIMGQSSVIVGAQQGDSDVYAGVFVVKGAGLIDFGKVRDWVKGCPSFVDHTSGGTAETDQLSPISLPDNKAEQSYGFTVKDGSGGGGSLVFAEERGLTLIGRGKDADKAGQLLVAVADKLDSL
jgi:hypothetical protein